MSNSTRRLIKKSGRWSSRALPDTPLPSVAKADLQTKVILPNVPPRVEVPAPTEPPWNGIALIQFFLDGRVVLVGTGFLCEPDVLITARHNLEHTAYDSACVWVAFDAYRNPGSRPVEIAAYVTHASLDLAVFILMEPQPGIFALGGPPPPAHADVALAGYASLPYLGGSPRLSYATGPLTWVDELRLGYAISTRHGDSGAPVFHLANVVPVAIGVHTDPATDPVLGNSGVSLSPPVVHDVHALIAHARSLLT